MERSVGPAMLAVGDRATVALAWAIMTGKRQFRTIGVIKPDEYSALADNNVSTNLLAQHNIACWPPPMPLLGTMSALRGRGSWVRGGGRVERDVRLRYSSCTTTSWESTPQDDAFTEYLRYALRSHAERALLLLFAAMSPLFRSHYSRSSSNLIWCWPCISPARRLYPRAEGTKLGVLRAAHRARLVAGRRHGGSPLAAECGPTFNLAHDLPR